VNFANSGYHFQGCWAQDVGGVSTRKSALHGTTIYRNFLLTFLFRLDLCQLRGQLQHFENI
jgi:hypothetical protein